jgi:4-cresol dehydrogenase (hydroxylating) flavoprotein subunit
VEGNLSNVVAEITEIVGKGNIVADETEVVDRTKDISLWHRRGAAVVYPGTAEEVAGIVKIAAKHRLPVWPFSKGKNWGYGATMPFRDGALILVLERMNHIIEVNQELAYAVVEPGVTQGQLNSHLKSNHIPLWADCTDSTPEGSVIGNALERGVGYTRYWDHFNHLCGLEVILANGESIRTGGGPHDSLTWHTHKWGTGPYIEGLFSQSNFGVVVKAGVWLMPEPEAFNCFICELDDEANFPQIVDALRRLALTSILPANFHIVNDLLFTAQLMQYPYDLLDGGRYLSNEARMKLRERIKMASWTVIGGLYGSSAQVKASRRAVSSELSRFGKLTILNDTKLQLLSGMTQIWKRVRNMPFLPGLFSTISGSSLEKVEAIQHLYPILKGIPGEFIVGFAYFKNREPRPTANVDPARDGAGMLWLAALCPLTGRHTSDLLKLCEPIFHKHGFDMSLAFLMVNPRSVIALMEIFFDKRNSDEEKRALTLYDEITKTTMQAGFQQYRTSVSYSDRIMQPAAELQKILDSMRRAIDPDNIIAPGHYGIGLPRDGSGE